MQLLLFMSRFMLRKQLQNWLAPNQNSNILHLVSTSGLRTLEPIMAFTALSFSAMHAPKTNKI